MCVFVYVAVGVESGFSVKMQSFVFPCALSVEKQMACRMASSNLMFIFPDWPL